MSEQELETQLTIYKVELTWLEEIKTIINMPSDDYQKFLDLATRKFPQISNIEIIETEMIL